jgi:hypothetical protein
MNLIKHPLIQWHLNDLGSIFAGTLIVGGVLLSQGQMREQAKHAEAIRQKALELQATEQQSVLASATAENRYISGCVPIANSGNELIGITPGLVVVDPKTANPLPEGQVICDTIGNTAVIGAGGVANSIASTGNAEIVKESIERWTKNLGGNYGTSAQ